MCKCVNVFFSDGEKRVLSNCHTFGGASDFWACSDMVPAADPIYPRPLSLNHNGKLQLQMLCLMLPILIDRLRAQKALM